MDLPVVLIKLRDYLLWFGPAYLVAISLGAVAEVALRRLQALSAPAEVAQRETAHLRNPANAATTERQLLDILPGLIGRQKPSHDLPLHLYIWSSVTSHSLSWLALLVMAQISWALALLRLGFALIMASLLGALVPLFVADNQASNIESPRSSVAELRVLPHIEWWRAFQKRFSESSNEFVLAAGLGALLFGLAPGLYSVLGVAFATPLSYISGATLGILTPFVAGTEAPLVAALQTKGVGPGAIIAFMLAVSATPWGFLRDLTRRFGPRVAAIFVVIASILAALIGALTEPLLSALGVV